MDSFNFSAMQYTNSFFCMIDGEDIVQIDNMGNRKVLGKRLETYNELEQTTTEYYTKLVELGVIIPPKTQEEQTKELQETLSSMAAMMQALQNEIEEMKENGYQRTGSENDNHVSKRKGRGSSAAGTADDSGHGEQPGVGEGDSTADRN